MKTAKLARSLLRVLAVLAVLAAFAVLDWYPTVRTLGRQRRQQGDLAAKMKNYAAMAAGFVFPDKSEETLLAQTEAELLRALPVVENDDGWGPISVFDLQSRVRADNIPYARFLFNFDINGLGLGTANMAGEESLKHWIGQEFWNIQAGFAPAGVPGSFPWRAAFHGVEPDRGRLAARTACVAVMAPLPVLLGFINHMSWGDARLEIVRLYLEPGASLSRAWLVCRGHYRVAEPSPRQVEPAAEAGNRDLLIDPDSPLLLGRVDPLLAPRIEKRELPPPGSFW